MIHMPGGAAVVVAQPSPRDPRAYLIVAVMCACGDTDCAFTATEGRQWVWSKWRPGMPAYVSAPDWADDSNPGIAEGW